MAAFGPAGSLSTQRILIIAVPTLLLLIFVISAFHTGSVTAPLTAPIEAIKNGYHGIGESTDTGRRPAGFGGPESLSYGFSDMLYELYKPIKVPVTAKSYKDQRGKEFDVGGREIWKEPLGKDVLVIDLDTRKPDGKNEVFNKDKMDWETVKASGSGLLGVSHVNHFIYSQIHGYDYKFFHAKSMEPSHHNTWIKPHVLQQMIRDYKFVVFIDADAIIQHLEVPLEFLFNRWNISTNTSIAMPIDTQQIFEDGNNISLDSKGKIVLNSGVVILQNLPYTHEMMTAWTECTTEKRYKGCGDWKQKWSHEQRAFSEYIRYDFNPDGNNIVEIPCNDANGYPGLKGKAGVQDDCQGEFMRHYTLDKNAAKTSVGNAVMQSMGDLLQANWAKNHGNLLIEE
ncbi:hypothetical protein QBC35DRAFT_508937 [Podospora australis]|uniref:Nucleotide-diphospho-sugar transferase domain-containing protein n=1 Tax=Podospora australis TaxID=1536484 RepID=A0AAN7ADX8_9PEZI|nr:hypothetical protein QBC35DRAFT_508937 [Podospora australis]